MTKLTHLALSIFLLLFFCASPAFAYEGEELGYIDAVTVNGAHFEDLDENEIVFYPEDLTDGTVVFRGILESEQPKLPVDKIAVEITLDGGTTWQRAEGHGDWAFTFRPDLERTYEFGIRVASAEAPPAGSGFEGIQEVELAMGPFTLSALVEATDKGLRGRGFIDLGFLNDHLPKGSKGEKPGLEVSFSGLKPNAAMTKIESGSIQASVSLNLDILEAVTFRIRSIDFSPEGANIVGALSLTKGIHIPTIPFRGISLTPQGIKGLLQYKKYGRVTPVSILSGDYGVGLLLQGLSLEIDTAAQSLSISDVDASLRFGSAFGEMTDQAVSFVNDAWAWGSQAGSELGTLTIPGTPVKITNIGGTIENSLSGLTLAGNLEIPVFNKTFTLDLAGDSALRITPSGISTKGQIVLPELNKEFPLHDFTATAKSLALGITDNSISGELKAALSLERLGGAALDFTADIRNSGLTGIKTKLGSQVVPIPGFADLHLDKTAIAVSASGVSVSLDGYLEITHPSLQGLVADTGADFGKKTQSYFNKVGSARIGTTIPNLSKGTRDATGMAKKNIQDKTAGLQKSAARGVNQGKQAARQLHQFAFRNLKILKDRVELPAVSTGWHSFSSPMSATMDGLSLSAESWGLGASGGSLWAGVKGSVATGGAGFSSNARATAQFYLDGRFEILDFAANASLAMGPFTLHTDAVLSGGKISGSGVLVSNAAIPSLPDLLKDAEGKLNLDVRFTNLAASGGEILSGIIDVPMPDALDIPLPLADIRLKALHFSPEAALADAEITLKGFPGIDAVSIDTLSLGEDGFSASGTVQPPSPLSWSLFDAPNDITATIRSFDFAIDTGAMDFSISDLDADLSLGTNYGGVTYPLSFQDDLFRWGETASHAASGLAGELTTQAESTMAGLSPAASNLQSQVTGGFTSIAKRLVIPGTDFVIKNPGGSLTLGDAPSITLSGVIEVPGFDTPFELPIPADTPLVISTSGISTQAEITVDQLLDKIDLEGFPINPKHLAFSVAANAINLDLEGSISLPAFGGIALDFAADFDGFGLDSLSVDADNIGKKISLEGFADLNLIRIATGFNEDNFFVDLDCDLTLTHPMLKDFMPLSESEAKEMIASAGEGARGKGQQVVDGARRKGKDALDQGQEAVVGAGQQAVQAAAPIALRGLKIYRDALDFGEGLGGWHTLTPAARARIDALELVLQKWGIGAEGDRFWVGFKGAMNAQASGSGAAAEATAQFYSDGTFRLLDMNFAGEFAIGPFKLLTDAQYTNGKLSGSGMIVSDVPMPDLPAILKDDAGFLSAAVDFENLVVDTANNLITDGLISLDTAFDLSAALSEAQKLEMAVRRLGFSPSGLALSGEVTLPPLFGGLELPVLQVDNLKIGLDGFSGTTLLTAAWEDPAQISILENLGVEILMRGISLSVNWSKPGLSKVSLTDLDGSVDLGELFATLEEAAQPVLAFAEGALTFTLPEATLPGMPDLGFSDITGRIRFTPSGVSFSLDSIALAMNLLEADVTISGTGIAVGSTGLSGTFALDAPMDLPAAGGFSGSINSLGVTLAQNSIQAGDFSVGLTLPQFFDLKLAMAGSISSSGIDNFHIDTDVAIPPIDQFKELATLTIHDLSAGYDTQSGLSLALYPEATFNHAMLKSLDKVVLDAVTFTKDAVDFDGITINQQLQNASFPLGPVDIQITDLGLTISPDSISTTITGGVEVGPLAEGAVTVTASPTSFSISEIAIKYSEAGVTIGGAMSWDGETNKFAAEAELAVAGVIKGDAAIELGRETSVSPSYTWWRVGLSASLGAPINLSPIPLNIYAFKGGIAYHMVASANGSGVTFTPNRSKLFAFQAGVTLGTSVDAGFTWHGDLMLTVQKNSPILFTGDTYFLKDNLGTVPERYMGASITIGVSEPYFNLKGSVNFLINEANFDIFEATVSEDNCSIQFGPSARDWHIYLGTKEGPMKVSAIGGFFTGTGYLMMDRDGLKFGFSQEFDLSANAGCFYGRLYGGVALDFEASIRPFYVDAEGRVWIGIEAGVKAFGERYSIIEAYASLGMKFHTPNPTYLRIKAKFRYSFCAGLVSGTYRTTFWIPEKPKGDDVDDPTRMPLVGYLLPSDGGTEIPRSMPFEMSTTLPPDEIFTLDNGKKYMIRILDVKNHPEYRSGAVTGFADYIDMDNGDDGVNGIAVRNRSMNRDLARQIGGVDDRDTIKVRSFDELGRNTPYTIYARAHLLEVKKWISSRSDWQGKSPSDAFAAVAYDEGVQKANFTTADTENLTGAREIIEKVYPSRADEVVFPDTEVRIYYRVPALGQGFSTENRHYVYDSAGNTVIDAHEWQQGLVTEDSVSATQQWVKFAKPGRPLTGNIFYKDEMTGEVRPAIMDQGHEFHPFTMGECWTQDCSDQNVYSTMTAAQGPTTAINYYSQSSSPSSPSSGSSAQPSGGIIQANVPTGMANQNVSANTTQSYRYTRFFDKNYSVEIFNSEDKRIYRSAFEVSSSATSNQAVINESKESQGVTEDDFYDWGPETGDINPLHVSMHVSGNRFSQGETQVIQWEETHVTIKDVIEWRQIRSEYTSCPGYHGVDFEQIIASCPEARRDYEMWLMEHPRPKPIASYGATGDLVFTFETDTPLNWDGIGLTFEIQKKKHNRPNTLSITLGRREYEVISAPTATKHLIILSSDKLIYPGSSYDNYEFQNYEYDQVKVAMQAVETQTGTNGTFNTGTVGASIFHWTLKYKSDVIDYEPESCNGNIYTGDFHCDDPVITYSDPYFAIFHYDHVNGAIAQ